MRGCKVSRSRLIKFHKAAVITQRVIHLSVNISQNGDLHFNSMTTVTTSFLKTLLPKHCKQKNKYNY